ncbi:MAG: MCE family protein [Bacteroidales bacterium]|nr:MCE family protein [Bacteroidales bacterium]
MRQLKNKKVFLTNSKKNILKISEHTKIGFIVVVSSLILIFGINFLKGKNYFVEENYYFAIYDRIDGLTESNPVLINGYKVGQVREIKFLPDNSGRLAVKIVVSKEFKLPKNTTARIFSSDLMGTKEIALIFDKSEDYHNIGDTLFADIEGSLTEQVSVQMLPLKKKAEDLMQEMEKAIEVVKYVFNEKTRDNLNKSFASIKSAVYNLEHSSNTLDTIVTSEKGKLERIFSNVESISQNLKDNNEQITKIINNFSAISDTILQSEIASTILNAHKALTEINVIVDKINKGEGTMGMLINNDTLYNHIEDASYNINRFVEDLRINPKRYVHYSLFDFGKSVNVVEDKQETNKSSYKIQLKTSNQPIPLTPENFKGVKNVKETINNGIYVYTVGNKVSLKKIKKIHSEIKNIFPESVILNFKNGQISQIKN